MKYAHLLLCVVVLAAFSCTKEHSPGGAGPQINSFSPKKGSYNNIVVISGSHFDSSLSATQVSFNGVPATVKAVTDSTITVTVPANVSSGRIIITVPSGSTSSADDFVVLPGKWTRKGDFPGMGRSIAAGFAIGNKGYLLGGADGGGTLNDFWSYDASTDSWTELPKPGFYLENGVSVVIDGKAYVGVGYDRGITGGATVAWWQFDPSNNGWTRKKDFPGLPRDGATGFALNGKAYVGLGWARDQNPNVDLYDWYEYNPTNDSWTAKAINPSPAQLSMYFTGGFVLNDVIHVGLGAFGQKNLWNYVASTDTWTAQPDYPGVSYYATRGFVLNGKGYIAGGGPECWSYDPSANAWTQAAFPGDLTAGVTFTLNNKAYYITGNFGKAVWMFEP